MRWLALVLLLSGCASPQLLDLEPPAAALMRHAQALPESKNGEDIAVNNLKVRRVCSVEISKLTRLQRYVKTVVTKGKE